MGVNDFALAGVFVVKAFHFYKKMNGTTSPTAPEMPIMGRLLTIPERRSLNAGTGVKTEAETPPMRYGSKRTCRTASREGSKHEAVQADAGLWRPGSAPDPSASHRGGSDCRIGTLRFCRFSVSPRIMQKVVSRRGFLKSKS
jgi:hypothetical protein